MARRIAAIALLIVVAGVAVGPIRSYDFFWHLAAGRWIVEHHALPVYDPFTLAAAHVPWINGEWLYQIILYATESRVDLSGISWLNGILVGAIFAMGFWFASRDSDWSLSLLVASVAFAGAYDRLGTRPATAAALLVVCAISLLGLRVPIPRLAIAYAVLAVVWINTHPSALLAPVLAAITLLIDVRRWIVVTVSAVALLINPYGLRGITAPFELTRLVGSGEFVNAEWLPSAASLFPLLYVTMAAVVIAFIFSQRKREDLWRLVIFAGLAALAIQHVRNQSLYFAALPLVFPRIRVPQLLAVLAVVPIGWVYAQADHHPGVDAERFPVRAIAALQRTNLRGNIYNVDQFGGYLEWMFYPERRVLTDGRNELFREFIAEDARARQDSRVWHAMQQKYRLDLAVDEYQTERVEVVDMATGERRHLPASLVRYRRRDWALIAFDDAAMVFARRAAYPPDVIARIEYRYLVPDDPHIGYINDEIRNAARGEVEKARREIGDSKVVQELERGLRD